MAAPAKKALLPISSTLAVPKAYWCHASGTTVLTNCEEKDVRANGIPFTVVSWPFPPLVVGPTLVAVWMREPGQPARGVSILALPDQTPVLELVGPRIRVDVRNERIAVFDPVSNAITLFDSKGSPIREVGLPPPVRPSFSEQVLLNPSGTRCLRVSDGGSGSVDVVDFGSGEVSQLSSSKTSQKLQIMNPVWIDDRTICGTRKKELVRVDIATKEATALVKNDDFLSLIVADAKGVALLNQGNGVLSWYDFASATSFSFRLKDGEAQELVLTESHLMIHAVDFGDYRQKEKLVIAVSRGALGPSSGVSPIAAKDDLLKKISARLDPSKLQSGASEARLKAFEKKHGIALPSDVRAL